MIQVLIMLLLLLCSSCTPPGFHEHVDLRYGLQKDDKQSLNRFLVNTNTANQRLLVTANIKRFTFPLNVAAEQGKPWAVRALIKAGANVNAADFEGETPLMKAVVGKEIERTEVVEALLQAGASLNARNRDGLDALSVAAEFGTTELLELLIAAGASPNIRSKNGNTALHRVTSTNKAGTLIKAGASLQITNSSGRTPLEEAIYRNAITERESTLIDFLRAAEEVAALNPKI